jgi:hypothetical protein
MSNKIDLLVTTNGRKEYLIRTLDSWRSFIEANVNKKIIIDDSNDPEYREWLRDHYREYEVRALGEENMGYSYLLKTWATSLEFESEYILLLEDDFLLIDNLIVDDIIDVLNKNENLLEMSLKRQAWSSQEVEAGGMIENIFQEDKFVEHDGWFAQRLFFTSNPSFIKIDRLRKYAKEIYQPNEVVTEGEFGSRIFNNHPDVYCAFWGNIFDKHKVEHIGYRRTGTY